MLSRYGKSNRIELSYPALDDVNWIERLYSLDRVGPNIVPCCFHSYVWTQDLCPGCHVGDQQLWPVGVSAKEVALGRHHSVNRNPSYSSRASCCELAFIVMYAACFLHWTKANKGIDFPKAVGTYFNSPAPPTIYRLLEHNNMKATYI